MRASQNRRVELDHSYVPPDWQYSTPEFKVSQKNRHLQVLEWQKKIYAGRLARFLAPARLRDNKNWEKSHDSWTEKAAVSCDPVQYH
jgi:hypothetical protein